MHPPESLAEIARGGVEGARGPERGRRRREIATPQVQLAAVGEHVLGPDGGRVAPTVERTAGVECVGGAVELGQVAKRAREVK